MPNLLFEFEKRYKGDPSETMAICEDIAKTFGLDTEEVANFIYINRYAMADKMADELPECDIEDEGD